MLAARYSTECNFDKLVHDKFQTAQSFIKSYRGVRAADPECRILKYWAYIEADPLKEMPEARKLWSGVVDLIGDRCKPWLEYAQVGSLKAVEDLQAVLIKD